MKPYPHHYRVTAASDARLSLTPLFAALIARPVVVLSPLVTFGSPTAQLTCSGPAEVIIEAAYDAAPPG